ncbi:hypothetical protein FISHEDRAFT_72229 [Fistulina hepatica ATCC 64428]|uniref:Uncharacterized protein n=1 Tax=Fistulina hepatica ATCC 64428 TaxID=1128425 RepID=A0A0D7AGD3_9AGAR|nr:hypothetical protein FISHEDRAFT_72229 [Fistulina hepatica ATCC 64428]
MTGHSNILVSHYGSRVVANHGEIIGLSAYLTLVRSLPILYTLAEMRQTPSRMHVQPRSRLTAQQPMLYWRLKSAFRPHSLRTIPPLGHVFPPTPDRSDRPTLPGSRSVQIQSARLHLITASSSILDLDLRPLTVRLVDP